MYTCTHVHMYTCTHVHMYMYTCTHVHMYTCTHVHIHIHIPIDPLRKFKNSCLGELYFAQGVYTHTHTYSHTHTHIHTHTHTHTHTHAHTCARTHTHVDARSHSTLPLPRTPPRLALPSNQLPLIVEHDAAGLPAEGDSGAVGAGVDTRELGGMDGGGSEGQVLGDAGAGPSGGVKLRTGTYRQYFRRKSPRSAGSAGLGTKGRDG